VTDQGLTICTARPEWNYTILSETLTPMSSHTCRLEGASSEPPIDQLGASQGLGKVPVDCGPMVESGEMASLENVLAIGRRRLRIKWGTHA